MDREKATAVQDLPHRYIANDDDRCRICTAAACDARHLAWETAALHLADTWFTRELGT